MKMESDHSFSEQEYRREVANAELAEAARDSVDLLSRRILPLVFDRVQAMLEIDRQELDLYAESGAQPGAKAEIFVSSNMSDGPMPSDQPVDTLTLLLKHRDNRVLGEALRLYLPLQRDNYYYPEPLNPDEDMPRELYFDYMPYGKEGIDNQRFVMKRDDMDVRLRYRIFKYNSAADGVEERVFDTISDMERFIDPSVLEKYKQGLPEDADFAVWLIDLMARLTETAQKDISVNPE